MFYTLIMEKQNNIISKFSKIYDKLQSEIKNEEILRELKEFEKRLESALEFKAGLPACVRFKDGKPLCRSILDKSNDWLTFRNAKGNIEYISPVFENITGYKAKDYINGNVTLKDVVHKNDHDKLKNIIDQAFNGEEFNGIEFRIQHAKGYYVYAVLNTKPIYSDDGNFEGILTNIRDISKEKRTGIYLEEAKKQLSEAETKYKLLFNSLRDAFAKINLEGRIIEFNNTFIELLGYSEEKLVTLNYKDITPKKWHELEDNIIKKQVHTNGYSDVYEKEYIRKNGTIFPVELRTFLYRDKNGKPAGYWAIIRDITKRKLAEENLSRSNTQLGALTKARNAILYTKNETELINEILRIISCELGYPLVSANYVAIAGEHRSAYPAGYYASQKQISSKTLLDDIIGHYPATYIVNCIKDRKPVIYKTSTLKATTWKQQLKKAGLHAFTCIPLFDATGPLGSLNIFASNKNTFSIPELDILQSLSVDLTYAIYTIRNNQKRLAAENQLKESEQRYRTLFENSPIGIGVTTFKGEVLEANNALLEMLGYSAVEAKHLNVPDVYADQEDRKEILQELLKKNFASKKQVLLKRKNGKQFYASITASLSNFQNKRVNIITINDITGIIEATLLERKHKEKFRMLSDSASEIMLRKDEESIYQYTGKKLKEIIPHGIIAMYSYNDNTQRVKLLNIYGVNKKMFSCKKTVNKNSFQDTFYLNDKPFAYNHKITETEGLLLRLVNKKCAQTQKGRFKKRFETFKSYIIGLEHEGKKMGYIEIIIHKGEKIEDIHFAEIFVRQASIALQRKRMESKAIEAKAEAEQANRAKSIFLANMSHEIRTPMNSVIGFTELLNNQVHDPLYKNYLQNIKSSGNTLLKLINDILDISKIEAGKMEIKYKPVGVSDIFKEVSAIFDYKIKEKGLKFHLKIDNNIPKIIMIDELRLRQILLNLLSNAVKFTEKGFISLHVECSLYSESKLDLAVHIADTGIGIPMKSQKDIFEIFRQEEEMDNQKYGGTGLGLAITKRVAEMMGGEIVLNSQQGKGSTFSVLFRELTFVKNTQKNTPNDKAETSKIEFESSQVLIVDDVKSNRDLLRNFLETYKLESIEASNGIDAIELVKKYSPGMILMDIRMPEMDGFETTERIKNIKEAKNIPIIALSAIALTPGEYTNKINELFDGYLRKPIDFDKLEDLLTKYLKTKQHIIEKQAPQKNIYFKDEKAKSNIDSVLALLESIKTNKWKNFEKRQPVNEIKTFGKELYNIGKTFGLPYLEEYANNLINSIENFDIETMLDLLKSFPSCIEELEKVKNESSY